MPFTVEQEILYHENFTSFNELAIHVHHHIRQNCNCLKLQTNKTNKEQLVNLVIFISAYTQDKNPAVKDMNFTVIFKQCDTCMLYVMTVKWTWTESSNLLSKTAPHFPKFPHRLITVVKQSNNSTINWVLKMKTLNVFHYFLLYVMLSKWTWSMPV